MKYKITQACVSFLLGLPKIAENFSRIVKQVERESNPSPLLPTGCGIQGFPAYQTLSVALFRQGSLDPLNKLPIDVL